MGEVAPQPHGKKSAGTWALACLAMLTSIFSMPGCETRLWLVKGDWGSVWANTCDVRRMVVGLAHAGITNAFCFRYISHTSDAEVHFGIKIRMLPNSGSEVAGESQTVS